MLLIIIIMTRIVAVGAVAVVLAILSFQTRRFLINDPFHSRENGTPPSRSAHHGGGCEEKRRVGGVGRGRLAERPGVGRHSLRGDTWTTGEDGDGGDIRHRLEGEFILRPLTQNLGDAELAQVAGILQYVADAVGHVADTRKVSIH